MSKTDYIEAMLKPRPAKAPAVLLSDPRDPHNVGNALRACSCWGMDQLWFVGDRVLDKLDGLTRLPREERMKGYKEVDIVHSDDRTLWKEFDKISVTPVAVEVRPNAENLVSFEHPDDALYVFGPEDGSVPQGLLRRCHRFLFIPTAHCLNLAAAVNVVLYDRRVKAIRDGKVAGSTLEDFLRESRGQIAS